MSYSIYKTGKDGINEFYSSLIGKFDTYAPVENFGVFRYKKVTNLADCNPDPPIKATMSIKPLFLPQTSEIIRYSEDSEGVHLKPLTKDPYEDFKVIIGVRPCDAQGMKVLEKVAKWDFEDEDFLKRKENSIIISTLCTKPENSCFCTSLDYDIETSDASDIVVISAGQDVLVKASSEKGEKFLSENKGNLQKVDGAEDLVHASFEEFKKAVPNKLSYKEIQEKLQQAFDSGEFDLAAQNCLGCNACAYICPTCHCFKVSDEKIKDCGVRYKCYDSCQSKYFTQMAGGHNPRPVKFRRWRQRIMHKFVYYKERFGVNLCIGCGKCTNFCPVHEGIFKVVNDIVSKSKEEVK
ncbi:MAG: 4Fe-4S dicluster domain-containing protein [Bacteroidota bacterium]|nr:4Fe-4S dicluster domain-containing protein [Bacteroidota bacterium]MDP4227839.1 4Fe-4S dicluster domain-containing protein [Bacteroidota bacterium]MDP4274312.1 4Fe-4S dicluster domain-containing protein [Bacteroidota bacterium]